MNHSPRAPLSPLQRLPRYPTGREASGRPLGRLAGSWSIQLQGESVMRHKAEP